MQTRTLSRRSSYQTSDILWFTIYRQNDPARGERRTLARLIILLISQHPVRQYQRCQRRGWTLRRSARARFSGNPARHHQEDHVSSGRHPICYLARQTHLVPDRDRGKRYSMWHLQATVSHLSRLRRARPLRRRHPGARRFPVMRCTNECCRRRVPPRSNVKR